MTAVAFSMSFFSADCALRKSSANAVLSVSGSDSPSSSTCNCKSSYASLASSTDSSAADNCSATRSAWFATFSTSIFAKLTDSLHDSRRVFASSSAVESAAFAAPEFSSDSRISFSIASVSANAFLLVVSASFAAIRLDSCSARSAFAAVIISSSSSSCSFASISADSASSMWSCFKARDTCNSPICLLSPLLSPPIASEICA